MHNTPPFVAFEPGGAWLQGPPRGMAKLLDASLPTPPPLTVWGADDAKVLEGSKRTPQGPPIVITWSKFRGPGDVIFGKRKTAARKGRVPSAAGNYRDWPIQHHGNF